MGRGLTYLILGAAILAEVIATTALSRSESFTKLAPSLIAVLGYAVAFWLLSFPLRVMPTGVVYAIWSGLGIVLIASVAWLRHGQRLDAPALVGMGLILAGVLVVNLFSRTVGH
ncbi:MAG TPA: SMR family transporter [Rubellimicrobium sp.]|jgi:small multidrug resistance pump|nr:SMR family transporter [Rubellimicrobium sp.]